MKEKERTQRKGRKERKEDSKAVPPFHDEMTGKKKESPHGHRDGGEVRTSRRLRIEQEAGGEERWKTMRATNLGTERDERRESEKLKN